MPDISMCQNKKCPLNQTCYRFNAIPSEYQQSYQTYEFTIDEDTGEVKCEDYIYMNPLNPYRRQDEPIKNSNDEN